MKNLGALNYAAALNRAARRSKLPGEQIGATECRELLDRRAAVEVFSLDIPFYRTADHSSPSDQLIVGCPAAPAVPELCASFATQGGDLDGRTRLPSRLAGGNPSGCARQAPFNRAGHMRGPQAGTTGRGRPRHILETHPAYRWQTCQCQKKGPGTVNRSSMQIKPWPPHRQPQKSGLRESDRNLRFDVAGSCQSFRNISAHSDPDR